VLAAPPGLRFQFRWSWEKSSDRRFFLCVACYCAFRLTLCPYLLLPDPSHERSYP
jgi:hypothetical protein